MEEKTLNFRSRVDLVCRLSDQDQPMHFLTRIYGVQMSWCFICGSREGRSKYHLQCDTCDYDVHKHCYMKARCRLSDVTKPHTLQKIYGTDISFCVACRDSRFVFGKSYYHCPTCNVNFHKGCHLYPPEIRHPFHPLHPLKFTISFSSQSYYDLDHYIDLTTPLLREGSDSETEPDIDDASISDMKCKCCQKHLNSMYYYCSICDYNLNLTCAKRPPPLTIINLKSHDHPLTLFPRRIHLPCDACGLTLNNTHDHVYTCPPCGYMVHRTCIYLPRVIKITRHPHRLSLSSSLPPGLLPCGVCRHPINITCGQFSCQTGCEYAVHSKCAVKGRVWDGIDLEDVPEDPDEDKDIEPFVRIDDETIDHFSHEHHLRLCKNDNLCDENRFCQACTLPVIISESSFSCIPCDFLLHQACASLPRKKYHPLHKHPLILHPISLKPMDPFKDEESSFKKSSFKGLFRCNGCNQMGCGFTYKCNHINCEFQLDTRCASLPDPLNHGSHPHDLFFNLTDGRCMRCKSSNCSPFSLECMECKTFLGLKCASLPSVTHYKHDRHPLTLCYGEQDETSDQYWCEICEAKLDAKEWFYKCDDYCNVTVHINCLLGKEIFMKPMSVYVRDNSIAQFFFQKSVKRIFINPNSGNTRGECSGCRLRCVEPFFFRKYDQVIRKRYQYCSLRCLLENLHW